MAIELIDTVRPKNGQPFPIVLSEDIRGGVHYAITVEKMNEIPIERRQVGMLCYVNADGFYQLSEDLTTWTSFSGGSKNKNEVFNNLNDVINPTVGQIVFVYEGENKEGMYFYDGDEWKSFNSTEYNHIVSTEEELRQLKNINFGSFCYVENTGFMYFLSNNNEWNKIIISSELEDKANKLHTHTFSDLVDAPNVDDIATKEYVEQHLGELIGAAPENLDTLNKISAALGNDANFAGTMITLISSKADIEHEHIEYVTDSELENEFKFDTDMPVVSPLGGIKAGENLNGLSIKNILNKMLFPYVAPTYSAKLTYTPTGTLFEKGERITLTSMTTTVTKKSENITEIVFLDDSTVLKTLTNVDSGGTFTYNFDSGVIINSNITNNRFRVRITDAPNKTYYANTSTISFCYPFYYGSIPSNTTLNGDLIKSLTKKVEQKSNKTYSYTTNNECMVIAYPVSYGTLSKILDQNSFDVTSSFNLSGVVVNCLDGTMQSYYVYMNNASTVSNFKITFNF